MCVCVTGTRMSSVLYDVSLSNNQQFHWVVNNVWTTVVLYKVTHSLHRFTLWHIFRIESPTIYAQNTHMGIFICVLSIAKSKPVTVRTIFLYNIGIYRSLKWWMWSKDSTLSGLTSWQRSGCGNVRRQPYIHKYHNTLPSVSQSFRILWPPSLVCRTCECVNVRNGFCKARKCRYKARAAAFCWFGKSK